MEHKDGNVYTLFAFAEQETEINGDIILQKSEHFIPTGNVTQEWVRFYQRPGGSVEVIWTCLPAS